MTSSIQPVIIDFDDSTGHFHGETRFSLKTHQETYRFGCTISQLDRLEHFIDLPQKTSCLFLGSGDFHHLSLVPLRQLAHQGENFELIVCDNHPDNARYPFGVHCGSWIYHAAQIKNISHIHVIGITSKDITGLHFWENHLSPFIKNRLTYWSINVTAPWLSWINRAHLGRSFANADELIDSFTGYCQMNKKVYLSIDKDVFSPNLVTTNWDQGVFEKHHLAKLINRLKDLIIGADVTGEISYYEYRSLFKRFLATLDGQVKPNPLSLNSFQNEHHQLNMDILDLLCKAH